MAARWLDSPIRRAIDATAAAGAVAVLSPVLAVTALMVRIRLGRPIFFRQVRAGRHGEPFEVLKFRTMTDAIGPDGELLPDVDRMPAFGRALRASSLDELPQLWTVVRGDMSLIGPRPLPMTYVERYSPEQRRRLDATPGITGLAQVNGRNALGWPRKLELDVEYVDHATPRGDAKIVWATLLALVRRDGISATGHATMHEFMGET